MDHQLQFHIPMNGIEVYDEHYTTLAINVLRNIGANSPTGREDFEDRVETTRRIVGFLDSSVFMTMPDRYQDQISVVNEVQNIAYHELDGGGIQDLAQWCIRQYLELLSQQSTERTEILLGLGQAWLLRAQSTLARIHHLEGSISSATSSARTPGSGSRLSYTSSDEAREVERATVEADARAGTADYVEARGMLLPATEYLQRAVRVAEQSNQLSGELLSTAAEAHMSLGNVSFSHHAEQYFQQAVLYLQMASRLTGFELSPYLQSYLDDFGRLVV